MASYRIYCLDGAGRIGFADWFEAADDAAAMAEARRIRPDAERCEVWYRDRMIAEVNAEGHFEHVPANPATPTDLAKPAHPAVPIHPATLTAPLS